MQRITLLGATGSIGRSTLDIVARHPNRYSIFALTANRNAEKMAVLCHQFNPEFAVMADVTSAKKLKTLLDNERTKVLAGEEELCEVASEPGIDIVVAAIVGSVGLMPTLAAVRAGKRVLLANKEALVMAGALFMDEVAEHGAELLPVDSEHNAIFQCLPAGYKVGARPLGITQILLTGSGGPFRDLPMEAFSTVTPKQAIAHPNWDMGPKISVDSATMMNKGLELIEACWLFDVGESDVNIVLHNQSIIHSLVAYNDGSVLAQMGNPDMRTPIAHALAWPERIDSGVEPLDLIKVSQLNFEAADTLRFPCLALARAAFRQGGTSMAILNAANEIAVDYFLSERIKFTEIARLIEQALDQVASHAANDLQVILQDDLRGREFVLQQLKQIAI
ncbi:MAG: 1-deoxy-D-xylulose-5-phosphate reductoisomerase [Gammaproteobacteria bacterium]|nr:1-deoxy-D-xylulose-5-phosphate reductoisomerase [Gammaproteobacteria bacterium]